MDLIYTPPHNDGPEHFCGLCRVDPHHARPPIRVECLEHVWEFREFKTGEEWFACKICGKWENRYQDTQGG